MEMSSPLLLSALYNAAFGVFHLSFWKLFRWAEELPRLGKVNRSVMQILNLRLTYVFFFMCLLLAVVAREGAQGLLPALLAGGMALFWLMRALEQLWFFGWRNVVSNAMLVLFVLGAMLHLMAAASVWK
jgi:hypothetical protein